LTIAGTCDHMYLVAVLVTLPQIIYAGCILMDLHVRPSI
jgi:hypothetical protein